ncbi:MAG: M56 family metallopeptidase [Terracidiphilus sp.]
MTSAVFSVIFEAGARSLAAALVVWIALGLLRIRNVPAQKAAWSLMLFAALAMPFATRWHWLPRADAIRLPALNWTRVAQSPARSTPTESTATATAAQDRFSTPPIAEPDAGNPDPDKMGQLAQTQADPQPPRAARNANPAPKLPTLLSHPWTFHPWPIRPRTLAWLLYLAVATVLLLRLIAGLAAALRIWFAADPVPAINPTLDLTELFTRRVSVRSSSRISSPVNIASGIVLPADYSSWDEEKLRIVLAHECSHVRQADFYLQLLAGLYAAIFWFSPLGWWLKRKLTELGEAIGDRAGIEEAASPSSYARLLLEFATLPHPTLTGVAMARTGNLARRIERLLNDSIFRQAFAAGRRRALVAALIVPAALFVSTSLVRVQASGQTPSQAARSQQAIPVQQPPANQAAPNPAAVDQTQTPPPATGVSRPPDQPITNQTPAPAPPPAHAAAPSPAQAPSPDAAPAPPDVVAMPPVPAIDGPVAMPPMPPMQVQVPLIPLMPNLNAQIRNEVNANLDASLNGVFRDYSYVDAGGDESWALVNGPGEPHMHISYAQGFYGDARAEIEKARETAKEPFLWFQHDGKSYIVEDPSIVAEIEAMEKPMEDLRTQMRALGKQQREAGAQMREEMRQQRRTGIPKPDLTKQIAELDAAVESLKAAPGNTVTQQQLAAIQGRIGQIQGQLARAESGYYSKEWSAAVSKLGEQEGKVGGEEGKLGAEMGRIAVANRSKIDAIIDQSLKDGKAKPVQ